MENLTHCSFRRNYDTIRTYYIDFQNWDSIAATTINNIVFMVQAYRSARSAYSGKLYDNDDDWRIMQFHAPPGIHTHTHAHSRARLQYMTDQFTGATPHCAWQRVEHCHCLATTQCLPLILHLDAPCVGTLFQYADFIVCQYHYQHIAHQFHRYRCTTVT